MSFNPLYHHTEAQLEEELRWIEAAKAKPEDFRPLYEKYYKPIFSYLYQRMNSKDNAFDLTSQVFLKALTQIHKFLIYITIIFYYFTSCIKTDIINN